MDAFLPAFFWFPFLLILFVIARLSALPKFYFRISGANVPGNILLRHERTSGKMPGTMLALATGAAGSALFAGEDSIQAMVALTGGTSSTSARNSKPPTLNRLYRRCLPTPWVTCISKARAIGHHEDIGQPSPQRSSRLSFTRLMLDDKRVLRAFGSLQ